MDGFGKNSNLFGSINGLTVTRYQEPDEIVSFELGKIHLMSGYKKLWRKIKQEQVESNIILNKLENIIDDFKLIIISEIDSDFELENNPNLVSNTMKNTYNEKLFLEIFNEINNILEGEPRDLSIGPKPIMKRDGIYRNDYWGLFFTYSKYYLDNSNPDYFAIGKKENIEELKGKIDELLKHTELSDNVKEFNRLKENFNNSNKKEIYEEIKDIYHTVNKDKMDLEGKCPLCPPHSWIDAF